MFVLINALYTIDISQLLTLEIIEILKQRSVSHVSELYVNARTIYVLNYVDDPCATQTTGDDSDCAILDFI